VKAPVPLQHLPIPAPLLESIGARAGTPAYVYSAAAIRAAYAELGQALGGCSHSLHYALKANSTLAIARLLRHLGSKADANSGGEIEVALRAGFVPDEIVFTGVGKSPDELRRALELGVTAINAESPGELERIAAIASELGTRARVAVRVNPDIDAGSHPHISTGLRTNKFGIPIEDARDVYAWIARQPALQPVGVHCHVGSQITALDPLRASAERIVALAADLRQTGIPIEHVDLGGGLGISYDGSPVPTMSEYAAMLAEVVAPHGFHLVLEPGRSLVGSSGLLLTQVIDVKTYTDGPRFAVLDAGMTELMRPALYGAYHRILAVSPRPGGEQPYEVVGPLCESSDIFGRNRMLPPLEVGDLVAILDTGAYGAVMGSTYNRRPLPPEILIENDDTWRVIRRRQTIDDLLALEE